MSVSRYHKSLRIALLISAFLLVFDSGILSPTTRLLSQHTFEYVAAVGAGMFASVPQNEINTLSAQLAEQQKVLDAREAALREREIASRSYDTSGTTDYSTYIISLILFIIIVLLMLNYVMDWVRARRLIELSHAKSVA